MTEIQMTKREIATLINKAAQAISEDLQFENLDALVATLKLAIDRVRKLNFYLSESDLNEDEIRLQQYFTKRGNEIPVYQIRGLIKAFEDDKVLPNWRSVVLDK